MVRVVTAPCPPEGWRRGAFILSSPTEFKFQPLVPPCLDKPFFIKPDNCLATDNPDSVQFKFQCVEGEGPCSIHTSSTNLYPPRISCRFSFATRMIPGYRQDQMMRSWMRRQSRQVCDIFNGGHPHHSRPFHSALLCFRLPLPHAKSHQPYVH